MKIIERKMMMMMLKNKKPNKRTVNLKLNTLTYTNLNHCICICGRCTVVVVCMYSKRHEIRVFQHHIHTQSRTRKRTHIVRSFLSLSRNADLVCSV